MVSQSLSVSFPQRSRPETWPADIHFSTIWRCRARGGTSQGRLLKTGGQVAIAAGFRQRARPFVGLLFGLRFGHTIPLLNSPDQLILLAGDGFPVVIGEFSPALAARAEELFPLAFDLVPIHTVSLRTMHFQNEFALARLAPFELARFMNDIRALFPG